MSMLRQATAGLKLFNDIFYGQAAVCKEDVVQRELIDEKDTRKRTKCNAWYESVLEHEGLQKFHSKQTTKKLSDPVILSICCES